MILLAYIILGHPEWKKGLIKLYALFPEDELDEQRNELLKLVQSGRLPLSAQNVHLIGQKPGASNREIINERSRDADLTILGFVGNVLRHRKAELFSGYEGIGSLLFVNTTKELELIDERDGEADPDNDRAVEEPVEEQDTLAPPGDPSPPDVD
jgi:hypothetical protein